MPVAWPAKLCRGGSDARHVRARLLTRGLRAWLGSVLSLSGGGFGHLFRRAKRAVCAAADLRDRPVKDCLSHLRHALAACTRLGCIPRLAKRRLRRTAQLATHHALGTCVKRTWLARPAGGVRGHKASETPSVARARGAVATRLATPRKRNTAKSHTRARLHKRARLRICPTRSCDQRRNLVQQLYLPRLARPSPSDSLQPRPARISRPTR